VNGDLLAMAIQGSHLGAFRDALAGEGHAALYVKQHATTVRTMFNRGVTAGWLAQVFKPFTSVDGIRLDPKPLLESDLPTGVEVKALLAHADALMRDMIVMYHHTGCRTHELIEAKVGDFQEASRTIVLGKHKRSRTEREPIPRTITLNADAHAILERRSQGRSPDAYISVNGNGNASDRRDIAQRFATVRRNAGIRPAITIYSFRHLWISEMLMAGVDVLLVVRMAGTSVAMIERFYGHFCNQSYQAAQAQLDRERAARGL
jgi:integrase